MCVHNINYACVCACLCICVLVCCIHQIQEGTNGQYNGGTITVCVKITTQLQAVIAAHFGKWTLLNKCLLFASSKFSESVFSPCGLAAGVQCGHALILCGGPITLYMFYIYILCMCTFTYTFSGFYMKIL